MKRRLRNAMVMVATLSMGLLAFASGRAAAAQAAAADDERLPIQADRALSGALEKADMAAAGQLLDAGFTWTNTEGKSQTKEETLGNLPAFVSANRGDADVQTHLYGQMATVLGSHHNARFVRVWVKRPAGWREFLELETPIREQVAASATQTLTGAPASQGDCENPCRTVPYKPITAMDKAILATWQGTKMEEWHPDSSYAAYNADHTADEFLGISSTLIHNKSEVLETSQKQMKTGMGAPGDPVEFMEIVDFGANAGLMIARNIPLRGGKPSYSVRVWVFRENRWQLALTQGTRIEGAAPLPPAEPKS